MLLVHNKEKNYQEITKIDIAKLLIECSSLKEAHQH